MSDQTPCYEIDEYLAPGLRYTEEIVNTVHSRSKRFCALWLDGVEAPVCDLDIVSFQQRFGAVAIPAEGIGGVETALPYRRQGFIRKLMVRALVGIQQRVSVAFVSEAIDGLYEKFGFTSCLNEARIVLKLRNLESLIAADQEADNRWQAEAYTQDDLPEMVKLYNVVNADRPWTHVRQPDWNELAPPEMWNPGSEVIVVRDGRDLAGYAIYKGAIFGRPATSFTIDELTAPHSEAARCLLAAIATRCWDLRLSEFTIQEPLDSVAGWEARRLSCEYVQFVPNTGEMMGQICHRQQLLHTLKPELQRRSGAAEWSAMHESAFAALLQRAIVPNDNKLLRLLLGFWSAGDAYLAGITVPDEYQQIYVNWFPGGGTKWLPTPYAHKLDRY